LGLTSLWLKLSLIEQTFLNAYPTLKTSFPGHIEHLSHFASILQFGHDPKLMQTRVWILQKEGFQVRAVQSEQEFRSELLRTPPDVAILCQTISADECERISQFIQEHAPKTRCILMYSFAGGWTLDGNHLLVSSNDGPQTFLANVRRVLDGTAHALQM